MSDFQGLCVKILTLWQCVGSLSYVLRIRLVYPKRRCKCRLIPANYILES